MTGVAQPAADLENSWQILRLPDSHPAVGCLLPRQIEARPAHTASAHRGESHLGSQDPDAARLAAGRLRHQVPSGVAQPLAQRTAAQPECRGVSEPLVSPRRPLQPASSEDLFTTHALDGRASCATSTVSLPGHLLGTPPQALNRRWYNNPLQNALSAQTDFPHESTTHLVSPAESGWRPPMLSPQQYACVRFTFGRCLAGCLEAPSATMPPTSGHQD
jgi:hypothetical protein